MTEYGLTATGFRAKTYPEMLADVEALERERISPKLDLSEADPLGNINRICLDELTPVWELGQAAVGALDPDNAVGLLLEGVCKLTGVRRYGLRYGTVTASLTFAQATTIAAGALLLFVAGETSNLWRNDAEITIAAAGTVTAAFTSVVPGADAIALAGTLTGIATPITGLVSAVNVLDADPGRDVETLDELRARREASLAASGKGTTAAIRAALLGSDDAHPGVDGVVDCRVFENDTAAVDGDGIPARTIRVVVWDGTGEDAVDTEIAQVIYDAKSAGRPTYGGESASATDPWGSAKTIYFDRATGVECYVLVAVEGTATEAAIQTAILAAHAELIDEDVRYAALLSAAYAVPGVTDVTSLTLGIAPAPTGIANISIANDEVGVLDSSRIGVTIT